MRMEGPYDDRIGPLLLMLVLMLVIGTFVIAEFEQSAITVSLHET